ncbi:MAG: excisionase family DNA-binding protein [Verrucomicrobia bacterium]|nr:excisionase family DNA-binding protein [Verrucomicrobiota bacterium]
MGSLTTHQRVVNVNSDPKPTRKALPCDARDEMLTKKELAAKLKVGVRTIERLMQSGRLPFLKLPNLVLFHWPDVLEQLKASFGVGAGMDGTNRNDGTNATRSQERSRQ